MADHQDWIPQVDGAYSEEEDDITDSDENDTSSAEQINVTNDQSYARLLLTNPRSLLPKMDSLLDAFNSLDLHVACITETWFKGGKDLKVRLEEQEDAEGIKIIH